MRNIKSNSAVLSTIIVIIFIITMTISAELLPLLKGWLKGTFGHHWIGKSVLAVLLWIVIAIMPVKFDFLKPKLFSFTLIAGTFAITIFYIILYLWR